MTADFCNTFICYLINNIQIYSAVPPNTSQSLLDSVVPSHCKGLEIRDSSIFQPHFLQSSSLETAEPYWQKEKLKHRMLFSWPAFFYAWVDRTGIIWSISLWSVSVTLISSAPVIFYASCIELQHNCAVHCLSVHFYWPFKLHAAR